jgi:cysteine-rich repeat protein
MITDNGWWGAAGGKTKIQDSQVLNNGMSMASPGVYALRTCRLINSLVQGNNGGGIDAATAVPGSAVTLIDSQVLNNTGVGVEAGAILKLKRATVSGNTGRGTESDDKTTLIDSTVSNNGLAGVYAIGQVKSVRSTITGNQRGIHVKGQAGGKITVVGSTIQGNTRDGVYGEDGFEDVAITVTSSNVNGNATDAACNVAPVVCADIVAGAITPRFELVPGTYECDTSFIDGTGYLPCGDCPPGLYPGLSFGVCLQDCNNSTLNGAEVCDTGGFSATCDDNCTPPSCGDLTTNPAVNEDCDDGNANPNDACKNDCTNNVCGDGVQRTGFEQCDDGNANNNDACKNDCTNNVCGDGVIYTGVEQCDDGNFSNGDGCSSTCMIEP